MRNKRMRHKRMRHKRMRVFCALTGLGTRLDIYSRFQWLINPRRACAARVTVVILCVCVCVCVCVCPGLASATHATTRPSRHTYGLSIVLAPELIWRFSKIAIALLYSRAHGSRPFFYAKRAHFPHSFRILSS